MKKLLILGANPETIPLIKTANSMGIYTIVTDPDPLAPAKKFANEGIHINGIDIKSLIQYGIQHHIDGVLVGVADRLIEPYQQVANGLNLTCYGNEYQCKMLTNKGNFNNLCEQYDLSHIPSIILYKEDISSIENYNSILKFPILIKPIDQNSGKGMSVVYNLQELNDGIIKAFNTTKSDYVLLEQYMTCNDVLLSYTIVNGNPYLTAMADRYTSKEQSNASQVCLGAVYPSKLLDRYISTEHAKVVNMLQGIGLKNAILTISAFVDDEKFYYYDPGFRLQGEAPNLHIEHITGFDQKKFLIDIALNNTIDDTIIPTSHFNKYAATIWLLLKKGTIKQIKGFDLLEKDSAIFHISKRFFEGDSITDDMIGTEGQVLARIYLCCSSNIELKNKIKEVQNIIKVFDTNNNNQLLNNFIYE